MANTEESIKVDKLARGVKQKRVSLQAIALQTSNTGIASATINDGVDVIFTSTLSNPYNLKHFAIPEVTIYQDSVSTDNRIPEGANIANGDYDVTHWIDWGASDGNNMIVKTYILNNSGSSQTILYRSEWRYIVEMST